MADEKPKVENPTVPEIMGVPINNVALLTGIRNMKKNHCTKEEAIKLSGAPYEVVDRIYQEKPTTS
jgi:hypothetical protein